MWIAFFVLTIRLIASFDDKSYYEESSPRKIGSHYESTLSSDGKIVSTREVEDWTNSNKGSAKSAAIFFFYPVILFSSPFWAIPYFLYTLSFKSTSYKLVPQTIMDAIELTQIELKDRKVPYKKTAAFSKKNDEYTEKVSKAKSMIRLLDYQGVVHEIKKIPVPAIEIYHGKEKYVVVDQSPNRIYTLLLSRAENGQIKGYIWDQSGYIIYDGEKEIEEKWVEVWQTISSNDVLPMTAEKYVAYL